MFTPAELAQGTSIRPQMTADEWYQTTAMLNDFLNANAADPRISFVDLAWFRDQTDDLQDAGNLQLAMEAMYSLQSQNGKLFGDPANGHMGVYDAPMVGTLYAWGQANPAQAPSANAAILGPFSNGLLAALRKQGGTNVAGVTTGWRSHGRYLPAKMAMRRIG